jgi:ubiquinone/menaquinone biosynthesis C-methylase UbiE
MSARRPLEKTPALDKTKASKDYLAKDAIHEEWESDYLSEDLEKYYNAAFARLIKELGAKPGDSILDAGCGYCVHASRLARAGLDVTGVDFSPVALREAKENLTKAGLSIDLHQGNLLDLPFEDGQFPYVMCWGVLMHIPELEQALGQLTRVLKPGGRLVLSENNQTSLHVRLWERFVLGAKAVMGRPLPRREQTERGIEEWRDEGLMIRKLDFEWLDSWAEKNGLRRVARFSGQFSEMYTAMPFDWANRAVMDLNQNWFENDRSPELALSNIVIFEKQA